MDVKKININQSELTYNIASDIYDVSARNNNTTFESLSALLSDSNLSTLIPTEVRCGGMTIRFVQSSDNKYVQYKLISNRFNTTVSNWQEQNNNLTTPAYYSDNFEFNKVVKELYIIKTDESYQYDVSIYDTLDLYINTTDGQWKLLLYSSSNEGVTIGLNTVTEKPVNGYYVFTSNNAKFKAYMLINWDNGTDGLKLYSASISLNSYVTSLDYNPSLKYYYVDSKEINAEISKNKFVTSNSLTANKFFKEFYYIPTENSDLSLVKYVRISRNYNGEWVVVFIKESSTNSEVAKFSTTTNLENNNLIYIKAFGSNRPGSFNAWAVVNWDAVEDGKMSPYNDEVEFSSLIYDVNNSPSINQYLHKNDNFYQLENETYSSLLDAITAIPSSDRKKYMSIKFFNLENNCTQIWSYNYTGENENYKSNFLNVDNWDCGCDIINEFKENTELERKYYYYIDDDGTITKHDSMHSWYVVISKVEGASQVRLKGDLYSMTSKRPYAFYNSYSEFTYSTFISGGAAMSNTSLETAPFDIIVDVPSNAKMVAVLVRVSIPHIYIKKAYDYHSAIDYLYNKNEGIGSNIILNNQKAQLLLSILGQINAAIDYSGTKDIKYFCFAHISDSHGENDKVKRMIELLNSKEFNLIDAAIHTGDSVHFSFDNLGERSTIVSNKDLINNSIKPFLFTIGNHDVFQAPTYQDVYNSWIKPMVDKGLLVDGVNISAPNLYYYYDFTRYNIRYISLCDFEPLADGHKSLTHESVKQAQCDWLIDTLKATPDNYTIIVGKHCPYKTSAPGSNKWKDWNDDTPALNTKSLLDGDPLRDILYAYKNKTTLSKTYNYVDVSAENVDPLPSGIQPIVISSVSGNHIADFSSANGVLAMIVEGHMHADVIYQGTDYSGMTEVVNGDSAWKKTSYRKRIDYGRTKDCFNLYVVNTSERKVSVIKIGCTIKKDLSECDTISFTY